MLWAKLWPLKNSFVGGLTFCILNLIWFDNWAFQEIIQQKWGFRVGHNPLTDVLLDWHLSPIQRRQCKKKEKPGIEKSLESLNGSNLLVP